MAATPEGHPNRAMYLSNLGVALQNAGSSGPGRRTIWTARSRRTSRRWPPPPQDHPDRAIYLSNLGTALHDRFERTGTLDDLDRAIETGEQAVAATPEDHPNRPMYLSNLGVALAPGSSGPGRRTIWTARSRSASRRWPPPPKDHPDRAARLFNLGLALRDRFERTGTPGDLDRALGCFGRRRGWCQPRLMCARARPESGVAWR